MPNPPVTQQPPQQQHAQAPSPYVAPPHNAPVQHHATAGQPPVAHHSHPYQTAPPHQQQQYQSAPQTYTSVWESAHTQQQHSSSYQAAQTQALATTAPVSQPSTQSPGPGSTSVPSITVGGAASSGGTQITYQPAQSHQNYSAAATAAPPPPQGYVPTAFSRQDTAVKSPPAVMTKALEDTASRKSQFGFGGNHVVPSVPLPPSVQQHMQKQQKKRAGIAAARSGEEGNESSKLPRTSMTSTSPSPSAVTAVATAADIPINGNVAYERKKQKAKQSRVLLNDSIDRLSVAINVAGQQSRSRLDVLGEIFHHLNTTQAMLDCETAAKSAKKYDRPAFVASAADMVQALNDQCEALVQEVRYLKDCTPETNATEIETSDAAVSNVMPPAVSAPSILAKCSSNLLFASGSCQGPPSSSALNAMPQASAMAIDQTSFAPTSASGTVTKDLVHPTLNTAQARSVNTAMIPAVLEIKPGQDNCGRLWAQGPVLASLLSFMDPKSIVRCLSVSRTWSQLEELCGDEVWRELCLKRFGAAKVELWENTDYFRYTLFGPNKQMQLYKAMSEANVAPATNEANTMDGAPVYEQSNLNLGHATLSGVSAWASMISRSNGETLRSVKSEQVSKAGTNTSPSTTFSSLPVVELRIVVQNTGIESSVIIPEQPIAIDASTRRRREEFTEITSDERFCKQAVPLKVESPNAQEYIHATASSVHAVSGGSATPTPSAAESISTSALQSQEEMFRLRLFDAVVLIVHIHAKGCCTTSKFLKKANFTKLLVTTNGTTRPMVIPIDHYSVSENDSSTSSGFQGGDAISNAPCLVLQQQQQRKTSLVQPM
jgi:hypothetical protein